MPFSANTKSIMFIKSARICCLCYKQCGTNIEAAHIIDEHKGGSNDEDNGIPVCFDCHQEIGSYDPKHPKGNKFSEVELKARRNKIYDLVSSGFLQAQIIIQRLRDAKGVRFDFSQTEIETQKYKPSGDVKLLLNDAKKGYSSIKSLPYKISLLPPDGKAYIIEKLVDDFTEDDVLLPLLSIISEEKDTDKALVILEQLTRKVTFSSDLYLKRDFAKGVPINLFTNVNEELRTAFFIELIEIFIEDQYNDVNVVAGATVRIQSTIPDNLKPKYAKALLHMAKSHAYDGRPAARRALDELPDDLVKYCLEVFDPDFISWHRDDFYKEFVKNYKKQWQKSNRDVLNDFITLDDDEFHTKYRRRIK